MEEAVSKARKEWSSEQSCTDNQSDVADQIAAARREWIKNHNDELERRLSNAIEEVRRIWDEEQKLKTKEVINLTQYRLRNAWVYFPQPRSQGLSSSRQKHQNAFGGKKRDPGNEVVFPAVLPSRICTLWSYLSQRRRVFLRFHLGFIVLCK